MTDSPVRVCVCPATDHRAQPRASTGPGQLCKGNSQPSPNPGDLGSSPAGLLAHPSGETLPGSRGGGKSQAPRKCWLSGWASELHVPLSPFLRTTWRRLGFCQFKKQLHLKAISFLIAGRLLSRCLAAGSQSREPGPDAPFRAASWLRPVLPSPARGRLLPTGTPPGSVTQMGGCRGRCQPVIHSFLHHKLAV